MELDEVIQGIVSAIGGFDYSDDEKVYVLGDEALACLKDLKRYLQVVDEKYKVWQIRSLLSSLQLVTNDICPILSDWDKDITNYRNWRIALACVELLVPLTWPLETEHETFRENVDVLYNLRQAQSNYKNSILSYKKGSVLSAILAVLLKPLSTPAESRTLRDKGIIRIVLLLFRNILQIDELKTKNETIISFEKAHILDLIVTLVSNLDEFEHFDVYILEIVYSLIRGCKPSALFSDASLTNSQTELNSLLLKESTQNRYLKRNAHTRHNRFGTMLSVQTEDRRFTIASQNIKTDGLDELDSHKRFRKRGTRRKHFDDINKSFFINTEAGTALRNFAVEFLEAGFNPLFQSLLKDLEREDSRVLPIHKMQLLYVQSFFLEFMRFSSKPKKTEEIYSNDYSFGLAASVFDQRALIMHNRLMVESFEMKQWSTFQASMLSMTQLLFTLRMLLKELEKFSSAKQYLYVKKRRRNQKSVDSNVLESDEDEESSLINANAAVEDRLFDFGRYESRYCDNGCIDSFVLFLQCYQDLDSKQIHRAISFFYRIFVKQKCHVYLYRLDFLRVLDKMFNDHVYFSTTNSARQDFEQFFVYYMRKLSDALKDVPALFIELPFPKLTDTFYYLEYGKSPLFSIHGSRKGPLYETVPDLSHLEKVAAVVACLINENKSDLLDELKVQLNCLISERKLITLADENKYINEGGNDGERMGKNLKGDTDSFNTALLKDGKFRLLLELCGFEESDNNIDVQALWKLPNSVTIDELVEHAMLLRRFTDDPPTFEGTKPEDLLVRKQRGNVRLPSSSEGETSDEEIEFEADDPITFANRREALNKITDRKRKKMKTNETIIDHTTRKKKENHLRSAKYIVDSDDDSETDIAFFQSEAALREKNAQKASALFKRIDDLEMEGKLQEIEQLSENSSSD
ncbi:Mating-type switching protein swi1 [Schizosaccharomyces pombe]